MPTVGFSSSARRRRGIVVVALLGAAGAGAYSWYVRPPPESVEVRARELKQTIVSSGQVMPPAEVRLDSLLTSSVKGILKREGDSVLAGEVLLILDESEVRAARLQAEALVAQARAGKKGLSATTLPQANEVVAQIRAALAEARTELQRQRQLFEAGVTTATALAQAERAEQVYASQEKAALLQVQATSAQGSASLSAAAAISVAEAQLAALKVTEARTQIVAPMDGIISARFVEVGEVVRPGSPLLVLTASGRTRIVLEPDERNLALLAIGQQATVSAEAFPSESFPALVTYIAPAVNGDRGTIEVRLDVQHPPPYLRPNMTVSVELSVDTRHHAVAVPLTAVQGLGSTEPWLAVLDKHGEVERRIVRLGLRGDDLVEVVSGVVAGERVVLEPPETVQRRPGAER